MPADRTSLLLVGTVAALALFGFVVQGQQRSALQERVIALETQVAALSFTAPGAREGRGRGRGRGARGDDADPALGLPGPEPDDLALARAIARRATAEASGDPELVLGVLESEDPAVQERVGDLVRRGIETERDERMEQRRQRMEQRSQERLDELVKTAGLSVAQREELSGALSAEREQVFTMFRAARETGTWDEARQAADTIRAETDARAAQVLHDQQLAEWAAMREEEQERWGRP